DQKNDVQSEHPGERSARGDVCMHVHIFDRVRCARKSQTPCQACARARIMRCGCAPRVARQDHRNGSDQATVEREAMALRRVWVDDGCILCNLCAEVAPEVFVLEDEHCWVRPDAE